MPNLSAVCVRYCTFFLHAYSIVSYRDAEPEALTEQHAYGFMSITPCNVSISTTRPPSAPTTTVPVVSVASFDPVCLREVSPQKPLPGSESLGEMLLCIMIRHFSASVVVNF